MHDTYEIGCCYEVTLTEGSAIVFRFIGGDPPQVECPLGSPKFQSFNSLFTTFYEVKKVTCLN